MNYTIGFLMGYIGMYVLPAIIVLILSKRLSQERARNILIWCFAIFTLGIGIGAKSAVLKGIAIPVAAVIYFLVYQAVLRRNK